jgi:plastocyanin
VIGVNNTVYWVNDDSVVHTVTGFRGSSPAFDSGSMLPGAIFRYTFTVAGNYTYHCVYHAWMQGVVIVDIDD